MEELVQDLRINWEGLTCIVTHTVEGCAGSVSGEGSTLYAALFDLAEKLEDEANR